MRFGILAQIYEIVLKNQVESEELATLSSKRLCWGSVFVVIENLINT